MRGRPLSKDAAYAKDLELKGKRHGSQVLKRGGGAEKLSKLDPSFIAVLTKRTGPAITNSALGPRGMMRAPRSSGFHDRLVESAIQEALRKRGLK